MQFCIRLCPFFFFFSVCPSYIHIHHIKLVSRDSSSKAKRKREIEKFVSSANNVERVGIEYYRRLRESIIKLENFLELLRGQCSFAIRSTEERNEFSESSSIYRLAPTP